MVSAGRSTQVAAHSILTKTRVTESINRLSDWLEENSYRGYDTFDGLNARFVRPLTFETNFLRTVLQQGVRRFPLNTRPLLGIPKSRSTKGMGFLARGFIRMNRSTADKSWADKAEHAGETTLTTNHAAFTSPRACRQLSGLH
jgi:hypothetical protein